MCVNRISEVLANRGIVSVRPTEDQLNEMGITLHTWNKWVRKKSDPGLNHLEDIANFLECSINELIERKSVAA